MGDLIIKPEAGGSIKLQNNAGTNALVSDNSGNITLAGNTTLSGTGNNLGTVTAGTLDDAVTGDAFKNGTCYFRSNFATDSGWASLASDASVPFTRIAEDIDSCCLVTGGTVRFTVPATGVYAFWFSVYTAWSDSSNAFTFAVNGSRTGIAQSTDFGSGSIDALSSSDQTLTMTRVLKLATAKYVTVQTSVASDYYAGHSSWGGCRIG